jgi:carbon monoxide dehydrogenase subunit G
MKRIESSVVAVDAPIDEVFHFLSDFNHFERLMPEQVTNWQSTVDTCSFTVQGISIGMRILGKNSPNSIHIIAEDPSPVRFDLKAALEPEAPASTKARLVMDADVNPFLAMVVASPLENLLNMMIGKLKEVMESRPQGM